MAETGFEHQLSAVESPSGVLTNALAAISLEMIAEHVPKRVAAGVWMLSSKKGAKSMIPCSCSHIRTMVQVRQL